MPLIDTGLVVRYYCDEAASGTSPATLLDVSGSAYNLPITYDGSELVYVDVGGNRGLDFTTTATDGRANKAVTTSDTIDAALDGVSSATFEVVMRVDAVTGSHSRMFGIHDRVGGDYDIGLKATSTSNYVFQARTGGVFESAIDLAASSRAVYHIVWDRTEATQIDRVKFYKNNVELTVGKTGNMDNSTDLNIQAGSVDLIVGNRESTGSFQRAFDGVLFYAAIYTGVLSAADRTTNYTILDADDDTPGGPAPAGPGTAAYTYRRRRGMAV